MLPIPEVQNSEVSKPSKKKTRFAKTVAMAISTFFEIDIVHGNNEPKRSEANQKISKKREAKIRVKKKNI